MGSGSSSSRPPDKDMEVTKSVPDFEVRETSCSIPSSSNRKTRTTSASKVRPAATNRETSGRMDNKHQDHSSVGGYVKLKEMVKEADEKAEKSEGKRMEMEKQMAPLESENFDLQDQISNLENQLEYYKNASAINEQKDCDETLHVKDQYIEKLEKETKAVQEDINKLRIKFKKKLRAANSQIAEAKQESSLKVFEMKNEMARLQEENDKLEEKARHGNLPCDISSDAAAAAVDIPEDSRTRIILDLSSKVSEQDSKIVQLQHEISQKDAQIELLNQVISENELSSNGKHQPNKSNERNASTSANVPESTEISEMKQIAAEMRKLKKKQKMKQKKSNYDAGNHREFSGSSRDSGVHVNTQEEKNASVSATKVAPKNDCWDSDSDSPRSNDINKSRLYSAGSHASHASNWGYPEDPANCSPSALDPSSIRRISAPRRRGKTQVDGDVDLFEAAVIGKPPVSMKKSKCLDDDVDALIQSIDEDILCVNAVSNANNRQQVVSH